MTQPRKKGFAKCPSCGEKFHVADRTWIGRLIKCKYCEEELEIIRIDPIVLDWAYLPQLGSHYFEEELEMGYISRFDRYGKHNL